MSTIKAVVMAGGEGSRLRPLTLGRPKPMVPIVTRPVMEHILLLLKKHGITEVIVTLQYMADSIQSYFGDGSRLGMKIDYSVEDVPLGTAGSIKLAEHLLSDTFLVISGDALTDLDLSMIIAEHKAKKAKATLTLYRVPNPLEFGVVITGDDGRIRQFLEKPSWSEVFSDTINTGIYVLERSVMDLCPKDQSFDFSKDLFPQLLANGEPMYGYVAEGYWCDVGSVPEYMRAARDVLEGNVQVEPWGERRGNDIWVGERTTIAPDAELVGPIALGHDVHIGPGVVIHGPTVIQDNCTVDGGARIARSIIWKSCYIGERAEIRGAIIGQQCSIRTSAVLQEGTVIGDNTSIDEGATIRANVKIWPNKTIESGATVASSIIMGSVGKRVLFGRHGVTGLANVDLTPEFAAKLGAAYGATLPLGSTVTINRDLHRVSRMLKRALISGLPSAGVNVWDLTTQPLPVARYYTSSSAATGGIHVAVAPGSNRTVTIQLLAKNGMDIDTNTERKIDNLFFREDFRRAQLDDIGVISYATDAVERYRASFFFAIDSKLIRESKPNIVVDYMGGLVAPILPAILERLGCRVISMNASMEEGTPRTVTEAALAEQMNGLAAITRALPTELGVAIDVEGERIHLVDGEGRIVPPMTGLAAMVELSLRVNGGGTVAVPVTAPSLIEAIAKRHGGHVLRTKVDDYALMAAASREGVIMAGDGNGGFIFPKFQSTFDGMMALVRLLEMLIMAQTSLAALVTGLPPYYLSTADVRCAWEQKARVMRELNERYRDRRGRHIDGVKIELGEEWVLVLPDAERPVVHVIAEGKEAGQAAQLAKEYASVVSGLQR